MTAYVVRRTLFAAFTVVIISFVSFAIVQLPEGDYVDWYIIAAEIDQQYRITEEEANMLREEFGLTRPMIVQYWDWFSSIVFRGDFGYHFTGGTRTPIGQIIAKTLPATILLTGFTIVLTWVFAIPIGIYSAMRHNSIGDYTFTFLGFTGLAVPDFLLALVLMYVFFAYFDMSVGGLVSGIYQDQPWSAGKLLDLLQHLIIPGIVLGTAGTAGLIRVMRNNLLDELQRPYVVTALSKGMANWRVIAKYPVRVAINPFVSSIGGMLPALVGGSVIVSIVLSLPTLGPVLLQAIQSEDTNMAGTIILMLGALTVIGVLISDLLLVLVDPRIKLSGPAR